MGVFLFLGIVTLGSAICAMTLRNLVHCALALGVALAGLAALYVGLDAQFAGLAQVLVYVGAVAILIVFAILLTRGQEPPNRSIFSSSAVVGLLVAALVGCLLILSIERSHLMHRSLPTPPQATVLGLGKSLMEKYVLPLEVAGLLLTVALIGAVIIAMREKR